MLESIILDNINLNAFAGAPMAGAPSEVFGTRAVFNKGKSYLVEASSGRGKSSFCAFLCGLRNDYSGAIEFVEAGGRVVGNPDFVEIRRRFLAMMFQEYRLFPELTAVENVMLKSRLTAYVDEAEIRGMLTALGLEGHIDRPCSTLSLGQQQRVAFVRALAQPCDFILLDEPISHLDEENATAMAAMLRERQKKDGIGVIVTSIGYRLPYDYDVVMKL